MRTTKDNIEGIIELDPEIVPDDAAMLPYITVANELVTECCTGDAGPDDEYNDDRLELIERWLAAHFYTVRDPRMVSERAGSVSGTAQSKVDLGFDTSHYGQIAMRLDTNGGLAKLNQQTKKGAPVVSGAWMGTHPDDIPEQDVY
ncbi:hypothetical protein KKH23_05090 [Patescibacteria group bacterium]|nr:hypothetical protein [Patescibacteria group bacterium]MBU1067249.1 hypothetical protein [Patescibacteria group bacterium]